jgi:hypothetical protein
MPIQDERDVTARKRRPPTKPVMRELPPEARAQVERKADEAAAFAEAEFDPADVAAPPLYFARMREHCTEVHVVEIGDDEDWWMLDQIFGQPTLDELEIWATGALMSSRLWPLPNEGREHAVALLNLKLAEGRPPDCETFERIDGIVLALRTFDTSQPVFTPMLEAAREYFAAVQRDAAEQPELFAPEYHPDLTVAQAQFDFWLRWREAQGDLMRAPGVDGPIVAPDRFRDWANARGIPVTETPAGPVIVAGKYLGGKLVEAEDGK